MTTESLGGYRNGLYVDITSGKKYYFFNHQYGMEMKVYHSDIQDVLKRPYDHRWGNGSYSNDVSGDDKTIIISFLKKRVCKYKTVSDLMKSRSKYKQKYLMQFSMKELHEYIKNKEDKNVKIKSSS